MYFTCRKCNKKISICKTGHIFKKYNGYCLSCFVVIASNDYKTNIPGAKTYFSNMGTGVGDQVFAQYVREYYKHMNPDENITFLQESITHMQLKGMGYTKFFWSDIQIDKNVSVPDNVIYFKLTNEARAIFEKGFIPDLWFDYEKPNVSLPDRYIVLHPRNIKGQAEKNMDESEFNTINLLFGKIPVVIVGSEFDRPFLNEMKNGNCLDLRGKINIQNLAWLCKNAMMFVGKDSGPIHIASLTGVPLFGYGFTTPSWFPITKQGKFLLKKDRGEIMNYLLKFKNEVLK